MRAGLWRKVTVGTEICQDREPARGNARPSWTRDVPSLPLVEKRLRNFDVIPTAREQCAARFYDSRRHQSFMSVNRRLSNPARRTPSSEARPILPRWLPMDGLFDASKTKPDPRSRELFVLADSDDTSQYLPRFTTVPSMAMSIRLRQGPHPHAPFTR